MILYLRCVVVLGCITEKRFFEDEKEKNHKMLSALHKGKTMKTKKLKNMIVCSN